MVDDEVIRGSLGDEEFGGEEGKNLLNRLAPQSTNSKGAMVVEVEKVVRDLTMLTRTVKMAKFHRILLGNQSTSTSTSIDEIQEADGEVVDQERVVQNYRDLLNDFFKLIVKLNNATE